MANIRGQAAHNTSVSRVSEGAFKDVRLTRDGAIFTAPWVLGLVAEGKVFCANAGKGTTAVAFAAAYDATAPDFYMYIPSGITAIPLYICVIFNVSGTEATLEVSALASNTGDSSATGTALTPYNMRIDAPSTSVCTITNSVDASGVTTPVAGNYVEFFRWEKPLNDTVATGENDRAPLIATWSAITDGVPPIIPGGGASGSALAIYTGSQAGQGYVTVIWAELPTASLI